MPDSWRYKCVGCGTPFHVLLRKHHCRSCGEVFCNDCTNYKIASNTDGEEVRHRVCKRCYKDNEQRVIDAFSRWRTRHKEIRNCYTVGQAFLLSYNAATAPKELAELSRIYFKGPKYVRLSDSETQWIRDKLGPQRSNAYQQAGTLFPDFKSDNDYKTKIYDVIDQRYRERVRHFNWSDASRRCYETALAKSTIDTFNRNPFLSELIAHFYECARTSSNNNIFYKSKKNAKKLEQFRTALDSEDKVNDLTMHRTAMDLVNALSRVRITYAGQNVMAEKAAKIWALVNDKHANDIGKLVREQHIAPMACKGRDNHTDKMNRGVRPSEYVGLFKQGDFMPSDPEFNQFRASRAVYRGPDFSNPVFAVLGKTSTKMVNDRTLMYQGGISGFSVGMLDLILQEHYALTEFIKRRSENLQKSFTDLISYLLSVMVYFLGGHSYMEMLTSINLPEVHRHLEEKNLHTIKASISANAIAKSFSEDSLVEALKISRGYEQRRRENIGLGHSNEATMI